MSEMSSNGAMFVTAPWGGVAATSLALERGDILRLPLPDARSFGDDLPAVFVGLEDGIEMPEETLYAEGDISYEGDAVTLNLECTNYTTEYDSRELSEKQPGLDALNNIIRVSVDSMIGDAVERRLVRKIRRESKVGGYIGATVGLGLSVVNGADIEQNAPDQNLLQEVAVYGIGATVLAIVGWAAGRTAHDWWLRRKYRPMLEDQRARGAQLAEHIATVVTGELPARSEK
jgi:hypothetical protein